MNQQKRTLKNADARFNYLAGFQIISGFVSRVGDISFPDENNDDGAAYVLEAMLAVVVGLTDAPEVD